MLERTCSKTRTFFPDFRILRVTGGTREKTRTFERKNKMYGAEGYVKSGHDELQVLRAKHFKMIELHENGKMNREIGEELGMTEARVSVVLRSPNVKAELERRKKQFKGRHEAALEAKILSAESILGQGENAAATKLVQLVTGGIKQETQLKAAEAILDRTGHGRVTKQEVRAAYIVLDASAVDRLSGVTELVFPGKPLDMDREEEVA